MTPEELSARCLEARMRGFTHVRIGPHVTPLNEWQAASALGLGALSIERNACELAWLDYNRLRSTLDTSDGITTGKMWTFMRQGTHRFESFPLRIGGYDWRVCINADGTGSFYQWRLTDRTTDSEVWNDQERWSTYDRQAQGNGLPRQVQQKLWPREQAAVRRLLGLSPLPEPLPVPLAKPKPKQKTKSKAKPKAKRLLKKVRGLAESRHPSGGAR